MIITMRTTLFILLLLMAGVGFAQQTLNLENGKAIAGHKVIGTTGPLKFRIVYTHEGDSMTLVIRTKDYKSFRINIDSLATEIKARLNSTMDASSFGVGTLDSSREAVNQALLEYKRIANTEWNTNWDPTTLRSQFQPDNVWSGIFADKEQTEKKFAELEARIKKLEYRKHSTKVVYVKKPVKPEFKTISQAEMDLLVDKIRNYDYNEEINKQQEINRRIKAIQKELEKHRKK